MTPSAKSEETLVPSQSVIGEIKMASILRTDALPRQSDPRPAGRLPASDSGNEEASFASQSAIGGKKFGVVV